MATKVLNTIEYLVLIVSQFAKNSEISEIEALCEKHYGIMHTLSVEENIESLTDYCRRKGGAL